MKLFFATLFIICLIGPVASQAAEPVEVYYFSDPQCTVCGEMESTLAQMKQNNPEMRIITFTVTSGDETALILQDLFSIYQPAEKELPAVFIGSQVFTGFDADVVQGMTQMVAACSQGGCQSPSANLREYYAQIAKTEQSRARFPILLFWAIFIVFWPIAGGIAIVIVLKKFKKPTATLSPIRPAP